MSEENFDCTDHFFDDEGYNDPLRRRPQKILGDFEPVRYESATSPQAAAPPTGWAGSCSSSEKLASSNPGVLAATPEGPQRSDPGPAILVPTPLSAQSGPLSS